MTDPSGAGSLRAAGWLLILSTPISAIVSFAALATVLGEDRLEGEQGLTALGWAAVLLPPFMGSVLVAWSFTGRRPPAPRRIRAVVLGLGAAVLALGVIAITTGPSDDPNIGGGVLILVGLAAVVAAIIRPRVASD